MINRQKIGKPNSLLSFLWDMKNGIKYFFAGFFMIGLGISQAYYGWIIPDLWARILYPLLLTPIGILITLGGYVTCHFALNGDPDDLEAEFGPNQALGVGGHISLKSKDVIGATVEEVLVRPHSDSKYADYILRLSSGYDIQVGSSELSVDFMPESLEPCQNEQLSELPGSIITDAWFVEINGGRVCLLFSDDSLVLNLWGSDGNVLEHAPATQQLILLGADELNFTKPQVEGLFDFYTREMDSLPLS